MVEYDPGGLSEDGLLELRLSEGLRPGQARWRADSVHSPRASVCGGSGGGRRCESGQRHCIQNPGRKLLSPWLRGSQSRRRCDGQAGWAGGPALLGLKAQPVP